MKLPESQRLAPPLPGEVIRYAYLWTHEAAEGREEARKDRPCAVVIATTDAAGVSSIVVVPLTSRAPSTPDEGMEIPPATRRRLGLQDEPCWAVLTEDLVGIMEGINQMRGSKRASNAVVSDPSADAHRGLEILAIL